MGSLVTRGNHHVTTRKKTFVHIRIGVSANVCTLASCSGQLNTFYHLIWIFHVRACCLKSPSGTGVGKVRSCYKSGDALHWIVAVQRSVHCICPYQINIKCSIQYRICSGLVISKINRPHSPQHQLIQRPDSLKSLSLSPFVI